MKFFYINLFFLLFTISTIKAQSTRTEVLKAYPKSGENGYSVVLHFKWVFQSCDGPWLSVSVEEDKISSESYSYEGRNYYPHDLGLSKFTPKISSLDINLTVYSDGNWLGYTTIKNVMGGFGSCFGNAFNVIQGCGEKATDYSDKISGLSIGQISIKEANLRDYELENLIRKNLKEADYKKLIEEADEAFGRKEYEKAKKLYQRARGKDYSKTYPREQLQKIDNIQKSKKKYDDYIAQGDRYMSNSQYQDALRAYQNAKDIEPTYDVKYKISEAESNIRQEEKQAQEENSSDRKPALVLKDVDSDNSNQSKSNSSNNSNSNQNSGSSRNERTNKSSDRDTSSYNYYDSNFEYATYQPVTEQQLQAYQQTMNLDAADAMAGSYITILWMIGTYMYQGIGNTGRENVYKGNSSRLNFSVGYGLASYPMFKNDTDRSITENHHNTTVGLDLGTELWPLYGDNFGVGAKGNLYLGLGYGLEDYAYTADFSLMAYAGSERLRGIFEYSKGRRGLTHDSWIFSIYQSGTAAFNYSRVSAGLSYNFESEFVGKTNTFVEVLGFLELPETEDNFPTFGHLPIIFNWQPGFRVNLRYQHRINFFLEYAWRARRMGDIRFSIDPDATYGDMFIKVGATRQIDYFGESSRSKRPSYNTVLKDNKGSVYITTGTNWLDLEADSTAFTANHNFNFGIHFQKDFNLSKYLSLYTGTGVAPLNSISIRPVQNKIAYIQEYSLNSQDLIDINLVSLEVPVGLRYQKVIPRSNDVYWLSAGINNQLMLYADNYDSFEIEFGDYLKRYVPQYSLGGGLDFNTNEIGLRVGLQYNRQLQSFLKDERNEFRLNSISLLAGFIF